MPTILVVEDDVEIREVLQDLLTYHGYKCILASNGADALEKVGIDRPDLVISDIMMPEIDGYELLERFQKQPELTNIPFIFLSAKVEVRDLRKGLLLGVDDYVTKPFHGQELVDTIKNRLEKNKKIRAEYEKIQKSIALYVPHELRTPLVSIMGYADLLLSEFNEIDSESAIEMISHIQGSAMRLNETIEKFLIYSELVLENGEKSAPSSEKGNVLINEHAIIEIISDKLIKYERNNDLRVEVESSELNLNRSHFQFMINQLADNAFKFSKRGSSVKIFGIKDGENYRLSFNDCGIGMTKEQIHSISAFNQHERFRRQQEGNGLGLVTIKKILELNKRGMKIFSEPDKFTKVVINLPIL